MRSTSDWGGHVDDAKDGDGVDDDEDKEEGVGDKGKFEKDVEDDEGEAISGEFVGEKLKYF